MRVIREKPESSVVAGVDLLSEVPSVTGKAAILPLIEECLEKDADLSVGHGLRVGVALPVFHNDRQVRRHPIEFVLFCHFDPRHSGWTTVTSPPSEFPIILWESPKAQHYVSDSRFLRATTHIASPQRPDLERSSIRTTPATQCRYDCFFLLTSFLRSL